MHRFSAQLYWNWAPTHSGPHLILAWPPSHCTRRLPADVWWQMGRPETSVLASHLPACCLPPALYQIPTLMGHGDDSMAALIGGVLCMCTLAAYCVYQVRQGGQGEEGGGHFGSIVCVCGARSCVCGCRPSRRGSRSTRSIPLTQHTLWPSPPISSAPL